MSEQDLVVPYVVMKLRDGNKYKAVFGVPSEMASRLTEYPVMCRGACFSLEVDQESEAEGNETTSFLAATYESIDAEKTAEAISKRLAVRIEEPNPPDAGSMLGVSSS